MFAVLLLGSSLAQSPPLTSIQEVNRAISTGRTHQARAMIAAAIADGASGDDIERALADIDSASGMCEQAYGRYVLLLGKHPGDASLAENAGLAALRCNRSRDANRWLTLATRSGRASWKGWNALGIVADQRGDWPAAAIAFSKALMMAPNSPEVLNNSGWSLFLQRRWHEALALIQRAAAIDPGSKRISRNLELVEAAVDELLPQQRAGETADDWAARMNDAGVIAQVQGKLPKARSAFSQAVDARASWFQRAANNLHALDKDK